MTKRLLLVLLFGISMIMGCAQRPQKPEPVRVTIAFQEWVGYGLFYLAKENGFLKEEGIELVFVDEQLDSARRDAFKQGMLDFEAGTLDLLVSKAAQDTPVVAVMEIDQSYGADGIVADGNIKTLEDLAGKKVVLARDDVGETFISTLFHNKGLSLNNVIMVPEQPEGVAQAFLKGGTDACVTWEPQLSQALQRPGAHLLATTREYPGIILDTLNVRKDFVENNSGVVKKIIRAWFRALKYYGEYPKEASEVIAKYYRIAPDQYRKQVEGLKWDDYEQQRSPSEIQEWIEAFDVIADLKLANNRISQKPDPLKFINRALLGDLYETRR
jgi:NitT/TauT family transport system substrate-binding protein